MKPFLFLAASTALVLSATSASAQATRTWVSGVGDDVNPCSRTAPCRTFAGAISKTAAGGEISVLDPGAYGAVTITKSMTIDGTGAVSSILATAGASGVVVNGAGIVVTLRRIQINGAGSGAIGVNVLQGRQVSLHDVDISGFASGSARGISLTGNVMLFVDQSRVEHNGAGIFMSAGTAMIVGSALVGNAGSGLDVNGASVAMISNSTLAMNDRGVHAGGGGVVRMTHLDIFGNTTWAWQILGGTIETHVDNRIRGAGSGELTQITFP